MKIILRYQTWVKCGKCDSVHISDINYVQNYTFSALEPNLILLILKANI